jgi:hypothetical protein
MNHTMKNAIFHKPRFGKQLRSGIVVAIALFAIGLPPALAGFSPGGPEPTSGPPVVILTNAPVKDDSKAKASEKTNWWEIVSTVSAAAAAIFAAVATWQTKTTAQRSEAADRAQRLANLWPDMQRLNFLEKAEIASLDDRVADIVLNDVNTMEKIAFCWEADLVDRAVLEKELGRSFVKLYDQIEALGHIRKLNRDGAKLLQQNPLSKELRNHLDQIYPKPPNPKPSTP